METARSLCQLHTDLTEQEILTIEAMAAILQPIANMEDADIFIDCISRSGDALVVAEAKPLGSFSSYENSVLGMPAQEDNEPAVARTFRLGIPTKHMKAMTQEDRCVIQSVEPIFNDSKVIGVLIREQAMDELKGLETEPFTMDGLYPDVFIEDDKQWWLDEYLEEGLILVDRNGIVRFCNKCASNLYKELGYVGDIVGQSYKNVRLVSMDCGHLPGTLANKETELANHHFNIRHVSSGKDDDSFAVIIRDITRERKQEQELILKSVAIKEIHHRVKNNLQTIASLLRLQSRRSENEETRENLEKSMYRILSIARTHELLAKNGIDQVKVMAVISNIRDNLMRICDPTLELQVDLEGDDFYISSDIATTIALVINEIAQNSLKYAFVDRERGSISIQITQGRLYSSIEVADDGCGFDVEKIKKESLGLSIVKSLVRDKLHGTLKLESDDQGTRIAFEFSTQMHDVQNNCAV